MQLWLSYYFQQKLNTEALAEQRFAPVSLFLLYIIYILYFSLHWTMTLDFLPFHMYAYTHKHDGCLK